MHIEWFYCSKAQWCDGHTWQLDCNQIHCFWTKDKLKLLDPGDGPAQRKEFKLGILSYWKHTKINSSQPIKMGQTVVVRYMLFTGSRGPYVSRYSKWVSIKLPYSSSINFWKSWTMTNTRSWTAWQHGTQYYLEIHWKMRINNVLSQLGLNWIA